MKEAFINFIN